ncbi:hypothetical protein B0H63DRAFT_478351 [Podospora didyma]|uniref:Uncharacterized protein n=1 Tax=Podospora didyma TaxID=330526 RepID=A0AAE0KKE6_9PEZI|nr:hypothetical protein B0H63DRAFT_478351 [Podospora didyma]
MSSSSSSSSKEPKESKHQTERLRQPQRKDSLSSVLSWAGLQAKGISPKPPSATSALGQSSQTSSSNGGSKTRRNSHGPDVKKKARNGSTTSRQLSFSNSVAEDQEGSSAKTKHAKTTSSSSTTDPKTSDGVSKTSKSGSSEKLNKSTIDAPGASKETTQSQSSQQVPEKASSPPEPPSSPKPKSILRVSSPDGYRRPRPITSYSTSAPEPQPGQLYGPQLCPSTEFQPVFPGGMIPDPMPISPPTSPVSRPLSPGATVRFAKATIHRVEVGPGRRFLPVKRKSKSTLTYVAPLDPGKKQSTPKVILGSPTKLRRHQENQAAMGRYWLRTEEEEALWRAEAERRAEEEAERYRNEPASPPGSSVAARMSAGLQKLPWADVAIDNLPSLDSLASLDKLETEMSDSDDSTPESGAAVNSAGDATRQTIKGTMTVKTGEAKLELEEAGAASLDPEKLTLTVVRDTVEMPKPAVDEPKAGELKPKDKQEMPVDKDVQVIASTTVKPAQPTLAANTGTDGVMTTAKPVMVTAGTSPPAATKPATQTPGLGKPVQSATEAKSFLERTVEMATAAELAKKETWPSIPEAVVGKASVRKSAPAALVPGTAAEPATSNQPALTVPTLTKTSQVLQQASAVTMPVTKSPEPVPKSVLTVKSAPILATEPVEKKAEKTGGALLVEPNARQAEGAMKPPPLPLTKTPATPTVAATSAAPTLAITTSTAAVAPLPATTSAFPTERDENEKTKPDTTVVVLSRPVAATPPAAGATKEKPTVIVLEKTPPATVVAAASVSRPGSPSPVKASNHLHLSGARRVRTRYFEDHKHEITA